MTFEDLWRDAIEDAESRLTAKGSKAAPLVNRVREPSFPAMLALLSDPRRDGQRSGPDFLAQAAKAAAATPELKHLGLDANAVQALLSTILVDRQRPSATGKPNDALLAVVTSVLEKQGVAVSATEAREVVQILESGRFFGDLETSLGAIFTTLPRIPTALLRDVPRLPRIPLLGLSSLLGDLLDLLRGLPKVATDLRTGKLDTPPVTLSRALGVLYGFATVDEVRDLLQQLLAPDNRSVRLALLLYARANGFDISEKDLDVVYHSLLATDDRPPDLGPVLAAALEFLKKRYGGDELEAVLEALQRT